jgi:hypothetical protein
MKNVEFLDVMLCGSCKTDVSEERIASIIRVTKMGSVLLLLGTVNVHSSPILFTLLMEAIHFSEAPVLTGATWHNFPEYGIFQKAREER